MTSRIFENRPRWALAALAIVAVSSTCFDARAQTAAAAAAESAFAIGRTRMTEGKYEEACVAFAESLRLEPATGTLYNIALCSEKLGRTASAWSAFKAVAADASSNADRARFATEKAAALEPQLSRVRFVFEERVPDVVVVVDGKAIGPALLSEGVVVDPGSHMVRAEASHRVPWEAPFEVRGNGERVQLVVPTLKALPQEAPRPLPSSRPEPGRSSTPGWILTGVGLLALGAGATTGILAADRAGDVGTERCPCERGSLEAQRATAAYDQAQVFANTTNVLLPVAAVLTALGVYVVVRSGSPARPVAALPGGFRW
jgi:tetratricopeptide (TPR) repeat protein